jgi:hypothetical protein
VWLFGGESGMTASPMPMHFRDCRMSGADGGVRDAAGTGLISLRKYAQTVAAKRPALQRARRGSSRTSHAENHRGL